LAQFTVGGICSGRFIALRLLGAYAHIEGNASEPGDVRLAMSLIVCIFGFLISYPPNGIDFASQGLGVHSS
jgi:hypothetical protein